MIPTGEMSKIGLSTKDLGNSNNNDESDRNIVGTSSLQDVLRSGINTFDTSPVSGKGQSEIKIGNFIEKEHCRENVFLSSKCGYHWDLEETLKRDTSHERLKQELGESMNRLKVNFIDLYSLNSPPNGTALESSVDALSQMQKNRNIRNIGLKNPSLDQLKRALEITPLDFVQIPVNILNEDHLEQFKPICRKESIRIIAYDILASDRTDSSEKQTGTVLSVDHSEQSLSEVNSRLKDYFDDNYPDRTIKELMASWAIQSPGVHSGLIEAGREMKIQSILRVLNVKLQLNDEDYSQIREILSSQ